MKKETLIIPLLILIASCQGEAEDQEKNNPRDSTVIAVESNVEAKDTVIHYPEENYKRGFENPAKDLGIGVIIAPEEVTFFNDEELRDEYKSIHTFEDQGEDIAPFKYKPEDTLMQFVCLKYSKNFIKVLINFNEAKYLKWKKAYKLKKWNSYIFQSYGVQRKKNAAEEPLMDNQLRQFNNDEAKVIEVPPGNELFCPVKVTGDWLKVKYDCNSTEYEDHADEPCLNYINNCEPLITGWLRWKKDNVLLLDIFSNF